MTFRSFKQAGAIACLVVCSGCAQVALMSVTPMIAAFARHVDQTTAREIVELEKRQDWPGMVRLAQAQLRRDPVNPDWWWLQGYALARQGQHVAAIESYQQGLHLTPEEERFWLALAQSQIALDQFEQAVQTYRQALRYRPESAQAYLELAELYRQHGELDLALNNYRECLRYAPESEQAWYGLAVVYQLSGQSERRDHALQGLRKLAPAAAEQFEKQYLSK